MYVCMYKTDSKKGMSVETTRMKLIFFLMEAIPLCDIIDVYINIYLYLYTTIFHNSE